MVEKTENTKRKEKRILQLCAVKMHSLEFLSWLFNRGQQILFPYIQLMKLHSRFGCCQCLLWMYLCVHHRQTIQVVVLVIIVCNL